MWLVAKGVKWIFCCPREDGVNARGSNLRIFTLLTSGHWRGQTTQNKSGLIIFPAVRGWKLYLRPAFDPGEPSVNWSELICCAFPRKEGIKLFFHHLKQAPEKGISNQFTTASSFRFPWCSQFKVFFPHCSGALTLIFHPQCRSFSQRKNDSQSSKMISNQNKPECPYL